MSEKDFVITNDMCYHYGAYNTCDNEDNKTTVCTKANCPQLSDEMKQGIHPWDDLPPAKEVNLLDGFVTPNFQEIFDNDEEWKDLEDE